MLAVKAVLALDDAGMEGIAQGLRGPYQVVHDAEIRHGGELQGGVFQAGVLKADGAGCHHDVPGLYVYVNAAAGPRADEGVRAALVELFHGDGGGGPADTGGAGRHLLPQEGAGPDVVLPVIGHLFRVVKVRGDGGDPAGIAGENAIAADVVGGAGNVKLLFQFLHNAHLYVVIL